MVFVPYYCVTVTLYIVFRKGKIEMLEKKQVKSVTMILALLAVSVLASPLFADMTVSLTGYGPYRQGSGGEFTFHLGQGWAPDYLDLYDQKAKPVENAIQTFCMEKSERLYTYKTFDVIVNNYAANGGINNAENAITGQDNISSGTAWLYAQFAAGTLAGYDYALSTRKISGDILQHAFWALEDEEAINNNNTFIKLLTESGQFANIAEAKQDYIGSDVAVMNLTYNGYKRQDQLILNPTPVPAPGAITLAGIGVLITAIRKRRNLA